MEARAQEIEESDESKAFDAEFLHNFGDLYPIPVGACQESRNRRLNL